LTGGGLFNPELANHNAVRDLLIDCREALRSLSKELADIQHDMTGYMDANTQYVNEIESLSKDAEELVAIHPTQVEPVAWRKSDPAQPSVFMWWDAGEKAPADAQPLYAHPPATQPQDIKAAVVDAAPQLPQGNHSKRAFGG